VADELRLEFVNDGAVFPKRGERLEMPVSIQERVDEAHGSLEMARGMGVEGSRAKTCDQLVKGLSAGLRSGGRR
jgi:hypothetical protein